MNISYNWLKQFLQLDWEAKKTADLLTDLGLEVEGIYPFESVKGGLAGVVVGHVLTCEKHPNADKLKLTTVDVGDARTLQIVCGAPNVAAGQKVAVATIGTTLYNGEGKPWTIKKGKIRGEESHGMICAEDELGLGDNHEGILILEPNLKPGTLCSKIFEVENDEVFEIGLTPNRADAMSHFGVARDLRAGLKQQEISKELITPSVSNFNIMNRSLKVDVSVENSNLAPRYCGVTISNLIVQPSPDWLKNRLRAIGLKPINNVVDATNYVLHELGQPLHAFDADRIFGNKIIVKKIAPGTKFMTLDGQDREIHKDDLMICDAEKPMCIAGVFGGINTGVTEDTTAIFLESAYFDPVSVRQSARRHGLSTDASFRFERGIDINNVEYCLRRAALLIKELTGGDITSDVVDLYPKKKENYQVFLTFEKINKLIGQEIKKDTIKSILASLDIQVKSVTESGLGLEIPFYRTDVQREVDVIEEILRIYGYNHVAFGTKLNASVATTSRFEDHKLQNVIGNLLSARGFYEILCNSLTNQAYLELIQSSETAPSVTVLNPLSNDLAVLRQSMLFTGLEAIAYNVNRKQQSLKFFEYGKTYHPSKKQYKEIQHLSVLITGDRHAESWTMGKGKSDFYYLKAVVLMILDRMGITEHETNAVEGGPFSEGITLMVGEKAIVSLGVVQKSILRAFDLKQEVLYADFNWDLVIEEAARKRIVHREIQRYPEVKRDLALLLDEEISFKQVREIAIKAENNLLKNISLFDVYTGKNLPEGKKSYAVSYTLQDAKKTLTDKQIDKIMKKLQNLYKKELGAELR